MEVSANLVRAEKKNHPLLETKIQITSEFNYLPQAQKQNFASQAELLKLKHHILETEKHLWSKNN